MADDNPNPLDIKAELDGQRNLARNGADSSSSQETKMDLEVEGETETTGSISPQEKGNQVAESQDGAENAPLPQSGTGSDQSGKSSAGQGGSSLVRDVYNRRKQREEEGASPREGFEKKDQARDALLDTLEQRGQGLGEGGKQGDDRPPSADGKQHAGEITSAEDLATLGGPLGAVARGAGLGQGDPLDKEASKRKREAIQAGKDPEEEEAKKRKLDTARAQAARKAKQKQIKAGKDPDYPVKVPGTFQILFFILAFVADVVLVLLTLLGGVGIVLSWVFLPVFWIMYWFFILRMAPRPLVGRPWLGQPGPLVRRSLWNLAVEVLPLWVTQFWPGWTITACMAIYSIHWYEKGRGNFGILVDKASEQAKEGQGAKSAEGAGAADTASPSPATS